MLEEKAEKENEKTTASPQQADGKPPKDNMMQEWIRLRNSSSVDLDVRLREINASTQSKQVKKVNTKKRVRRKKPAAIKKKEKELAKEAEELERSRELNNDSQEQLTDQQVDEQTLHLDGKHDDQIYNENKEGGENGMKAASTPIVDNVNQPLADDKAKIPSVQNGNDKILEKTEKSDKKPKEKQKKCEDNVNQVENRLENSLGSIKYSVPRFDFCSLYSTTPCQRSTGT